MIFVEVAYRGMGWYKVGNAGNRDGWIKVAARSSFVTHRSPRLWDK